MNGSTRIRALFIVALLCVPGLPTKVLGQDATERTVTVSATSFVERDPDRARVTLAVETFEPTASQAADANATRMDALFAALRGLRIPDDDMRTTSYHINPEYDHQQPGRVPQEQRIVGYRAINMVEVKVQPVERVGAVIDAAITAGANRVADVSFELADPREARRAAIAEAVGDARAEAEALAAAIGEPLGPVIDIRTQGGPSPLMLQSARSFDMAAEAAQVPPTPIEPGTLRVTAAVTIVYRLGTP